MRTGRPNLGARDAALHAALANATPGSAISATCAPCAPCRRAGASSSESIRCTRRFAPTRKRRARTPPHRGSGLNWLYLALDEVPEYGRRSRGGAAVIAGERAERLAAAARRAERRLRGRRRSQGSGAAGMLRRARRGPRAARRVRGLRPKSGEPLTRFAVFTKLLTARLRPRRRQLAGDVSPPAIARRRAVRRFRTRGACATSFDVPAVAAPRNSSRRSRRTRRAHGVQLYRDLAVGVDRERRPTLGASGGVRGERLASARRPICSTRSARTGACRRFDPRALAREGYAALLALLPTNAATPARCGSTTRCRSMRLFWIPRGGRPAQRDVRRLPVRRSARRSSRSRERARTLRRHRRGSGDGPPRASATRWNGNNILSYRILFFERDGPTATFCRAGSVSAARARDPGTHDLPTLAAWLAREDVDAARSGWVILETPRASERAARDRDRTMLLRCAGRRTATSLPPSARTTSRSSSRRTATSPRSPCAIVMLQIEDAARRTCAGQHPGDDRRVSELAPETDATTSRTIASGGRVSTRSMPAHCCARVYGPRA